MTFDASPEVWSFQDPRAFVRELCDWKKTYNRDFSFRQICRHAGFASPSYIKAFLDGKRNLRPDSAQRLGEALGLGAVETEYFCTLVALDQEVDRDRRQAHRVELLRLAIRHGHTATIDAAKLDYFAHWFIPVIHAMASLKGFQAQPHWIAARLRPKIRSFDAQRALTTLRELGLLKGEGESAQVGERRIAVAPELHSTLVAEYLRQMDGLAQQAKQLWPGRERVHSALTVTVPTRIHDEVLAKIERFREDLYSFVMAEQSEDEAVEGDVMHVSFQAFKVTDVGPETADS